MSSSSGRVMQWNAGDTGGSDCVLPGPLPVAIGVIPTLVIATTSSVCEADDRNREHKGIVFYNEEPVAWLCLAEDEIIEFKTWAATKFPSVQIVTINDPAVQIICPPQPHAQAGASPELVEQAREAFRARALQWFVPATPTEVTQLVA